MLCDICEDIVFPQLPRQLESIPTLTDLKAHLCLEEIPTDFS